ncbi:MAG TPA: FAD-binding oxidoreductase [Hyphomicrobiaceae bacterium]|nr:FAD-binding oxidoreductase [Hyphomicrobiaceae bacterium]
MAGNDVIVLGAGIVGISAALHLQQRGRAVTLIDRRGMVEETSFGNAGIIQREAVVPYTFPRDPALVMKYAFNFLPEANLHWSALPKIAPWLFRHWLQSTPERKDATARGAKPLVERCIVEHEALAAEAGVLGLMRRTGYLRIYRSAQAFDQAVAKDAVDREMYGVTYQAVDARGLAELEPHLKGSLAGGVLMPQPVSVSDPGALGRAYGELLISRGAKFLRGEARTLEQVGGGWQVQTSMGPVTAPEVVVAMGAWSDDVLRALGYRFPLGIKRGYHMHYRAAGNATLSRPVLDAQNGYVLTSMTNGIRLTTGAEFANRDAPLTPRQLELAEPLARGIFPLGTRVDAQPWLGRRPCLPDMLPVIGRAPRHQGLWLDFGHHHLGLTLGPVSGRLLAEMITGETPFIDPTPYRADRF